MLLKQRLKIGETVCGIMLSELYTPNLARMLAGLGFKCMLIDCEHGYYDMTQVANLIAVAEGNNLPVIIRVATHSWYTAAKYLDMGAQGILLAGVKSAEQAQELADICLYAPEGNRGVSTFRVHTGYRNGDVAGMMEAANEKCIVIVQIESPENRLEIDKIASIPGIDGLIVGPNDLTQSMGMIGRYDAPEVLDVVRSVAESAKEHGKWSGVITGDEKLLRFCCGLGMQFLSSGSELSALSSGASRQLERLNSIVRESGEPSA